MNRPDLTRGVLLFFTLLMIAPLPAMADDPPVVRGRDEMVVTAHELASGVGAKILERGGNAVDAAVGVAFAMAVVYPRAGNLGGGGFMIYSPGDGSEVRALDFREVAPGSAVETLYQDDQGAIIPGKSTLGWAAVGVPGTVHGLKVIHEAHGDLPWRELVAPAVELARKGFVIDERLAASLATVAPFFTRCPAARVVFLKKDGSCYEPGDRLVQTDLAGTLERIAEEGPAAFYEGPVAGRIARAMKENGGLVTEEDLSGYRARWRAPIHVRYRGLDVYSMPPPSSGGICLGMLLGIAEALDLDREKPGSAKILHLMIEAERDVYADRSKHLGDPDFYPVPRTWLLSGERRKEIAGAIDRGRRRASADLAPGRATSSEGEETTHFSIVDRWGNAVSCTYTLNGSYGAKVMVPGTGVLLNNEMDDFSAKPGTPNLYGLVGAEANKIEPGKRMLSSMCPTIVRDGKKNRYVLGTPGGSTIITTIFQILVHVVGSKMSLSKAVAFPRVHHQWLPDKVFLEEGTDLGEETLETLEKMGHVLARRSAIGDVQAIEIDPESGDRLGVSDPRGGGLAVGK